MTILRNPTCAVCGEEWIQPHDCPVKLTEEEASVLHALLMSEACDHYCCGMKPMECKVKAFLNCMNKQGGNNA